MVQFDSSADAWVLTRHADVLAALQDARLEPGSSGGAINPAEHRKLREAARAAYSPERVTAWQADWERWTMELFDALPRHADLIADLAAPLGLRIAAQVTNLTVSHASTLAPIARKLFDAEAAGEAAADATMALVPHFDGALDVQAFAALCHTLPAFLGNAWLAMFKNPVEMARLKAKPALLPGAIEELLRWAGPAAVQFRRAVAPLEYGGVCIGQGAKVMLCLAEANRDPAVFPNPDKLQFERQPAGHVAFGAGPHACVGAPLIRLAARPAIAIFATRFSGQTIAFRPEQEPGVAMRSLRAFQIRL